MQDSISDQLLVNHIITESNAQRHQHIQQLVTQYDQADDVEKPQLREVYAKVLAQAFAAKDEISMNELREFEPLAKIAIDAPMMAHAEAIASTSIGQRMLEQRIQELKDTPTKAIPFFETAIHFAIDTAEAYQHPLTHMQKTADGVIAVPVNAAKAIGHVGFVYTDNDRLDMAEVFSQPYEQRMKAYYAEKWDDLSDIVKGAALAGSAYKLKAALPEAEATLPTLPNPDSMYIKTQKLIEIAKEKVENFLPQAQTQNGLVAAGVGAVAEDNGTIPSTTIMHMASNGGGLISQKKRFPVTDLNEYKTNKNLELGLQAWEGAKSNLFSNQNEMYMAGQFLEEIQGMSDLEIVSEFNKRGYLDFELTKGTLFQPELVGSDPSSQINTHNKSIPDQATDYLHKFIKWQQNASAKEMHEAASAAFPNALSYRTANDLPLPDPTLHPSEYKAANKLYTEMADTLFKLEKGLNEHDKVTRIPLTKFLPNEEFSASILIVDKAEGAREIYMSQNELEIAGNLNTNGAPLLLSPYKQFSEALVEKFIDYVIDKAAQTDIANANNSSHEKALPYALRAAEQFYEVTDGASGALNNEPER